MGLTSSNEKNTRSTAGLFVYSCKKCGWIGETRGRPRCLPCGAEATRRWRANNPDAKRALRRRMRKTEAGRAMDIRHKRERRARNPETVQAAWRRRVDWLIAGDVSADDLKAIYQHHQGRCWYCKAAVPRPRFYPRDPRGFDHVIPRIKGGLHTPQNIVVCCASCNERKADGLAA